MKSKTARLAVEESSKVKERLLIKLGRIKPFQDELLYFWLFSFQGIKISSLGGMEVEYNPRLLENLNPEQLQQELAGIEVSSEGIEIMKAKGEFFVVKVDKLSPRAASILKQEMLAKGGEVALGRNLVYLEKEGYGQGLIMGTKRQYERLLTSLFQQPFGLSRLARELQETLDHYSGKPLAPMTLKGQEFTWGTRTYVMGIINVTADSFSGDGILAEQRLVDSALQQAERFLKDGADLLDIGGESTRPGAQPVKADEEMRRVLPVVEALTRESPLPLSVDTYKSSVAEAALEAGADLINDIWGLQGDPQMAAVAAKFAAPVIIMHNKEDSSGYQDLSAEVLFFLRKSARIAESAGLPREKLIIDPGVGFGKTKEENLLIIDRLGELKALGLPILLGVSRKSVIGLTLELPVTERMEGTAAAVAVGITRGADIIRAHDVKEMTRVARMTDAIIGRAKR